MAQGRVDSTKETNGRLRTPQPKAAVHAKAATLTADDTRQDWRWKLSFI